MHIFLGVMGSPLLSGLERFTTPNACLPGPLRPHGTASAGAVTGLRPLVPTAWLPVCASGPAQVPLPRGRGEAGVRPAQDGPSGQGSADVSSVPEPPPGTPPTPPTLCPRAGCLLPTPPGHFLIPWAWSSAPQPIPSRGCALLPGPARAFLRQGAELQGGPGLLWGVGGGRAQAGRRLRAPWALRVLSGRAQRLPAPAPTEPAVFAPQQALSPWSWLFPQGLAAPLLGRGGGGPRTLGGPPHPPNVSGSHGSPHPARKGPQGRVKWCV